MAGNGQCDSKGSAGRGKNSTNLTDRGKGGVKRSLPTEAHGIPIAIAVDGANRHDMKMVYPMIEDLQLDLPTLTLTKQPGLCLDKSHDYEQIHQ